MTTDRTSNQQSSDCERVSQVAANPGGFAMLFWVNDTGRLSENKPRKGEFSCLYRAKEVDAEIERLRNALAQSVQTVRSLMRQDETTPEPKLLAAEINALPKRVRDYIHHLETDADPAGDKWRLAAAEENVAALTALLSKRQAPEEPTGPRYRHDWETLPGPSYRCKRCSTTCLDAHTSLLCVVEPDKAYEPKPGDVLGTARMVYAGKRPPRQVDD